MRKQGISGFAIALVTDEKVLWSEGFGCTDRTCLTKVTRDTPFSIQSMSKSFTATTVLLAVKDGLLDLDTPISTYLPDFTVNSIFDERPQDIITLRMLLSHTAGFTHEAPVGNNNDLEPGTWETHIASISNTWLKFPVGQGWSYSNLGIDLAGYILEQVTEMPFQMYAKTHLFEPLEMQNSTFDIEEIERLENRAIEQSGIFHQIPSVFTIVPSGGVYASANDMARYLQFHINQGSFAGQPHLDTQLMEQMYKPHFQASAANNYGLGLYISQGRFDAIKLFHNGGGFGFTSQMTWYPDLKIGVVWLSNLQENEHDLLDWLSNAILDDVIDASPEFYAALADAHPYTAPAAPGFPAMLSESEFIQRIRQAAPIPDELQQKRWVDYAGLYAIRKWGQVVVVVRVRSGEQLEFNGYPMFEVEPGLFFALDGEALDFRGAIPTVSNLKLEKDNGTLQTQIILLGFSVIGFISVIPWSVAGFVGSVKRQRKGKEMRPPRLNWLEVSTRIALTLASLLALGTLPMLVQNPILLFSGTPLPHSGLHFEQQIGYSMVYATVALTLLSVMGLSISWGTGFGTRLNRIWSSVITGILVLFCLLVVL
jgi:CubicO group peptidase (beta-lactamase class C family)